MKKQKNGVSLITLIITIIVVVVLVAAIILSMTRANPVTNANKAISSQDISVLKDLFSMEISDIAVVGKELPVLYTNSTYETQVTEKTKLTVDENGQAQVYYKMIDQKGCIVFAKESTSTIEKIEGITYRYTEQELPTNSGTVKWYVDSNNALIAEINENISDGSDTEPIPDEEPVKKGLLDLWRYNFDTESYLTLEEYIGEAVDVEVPATYEKDGTTYKVQLSSSSYNDDTETYTGPFHGTNIKDKINSVNIADGVEIQNNNADYLFAECTAITSVNKLPDNVTSAKYALYATAITKMPELPETLSTLYATFGKCANLESVEIPTHINNLDFQTFAYCTSITALTLPEWIQNIGPNCLVGCTALDTLNYNIPNCGTGYYDSAANSISFVFSGSPITNLTFGDKVETIPAFFFYSNKSYNFTSIVLPNNVKTIGLQAFRGCGNLKTMDIGDGVETISNYAFYQSGVVTLILGNGLKRIGQGAFYLATAVKNVYITKSSTEFNSVTKGSDWDVGMGGTLAGFSAVQNKVYNYVRP